MVKAIKLRFALKLMSVSIASDSVAENGHHKESFGAKVIYFIGAMKQADIYLNCVLAEPEKSSLYLRQLSFQALSHNDPCSTATSVAQHMETLFSKQIITTASSILMVLFFVSGVQGRRWEHRRCRRR